VGGDVSARVTYWTGIWDPAREAHSQLIAQLRGARIPRRRVVSFSNGQRSWWRPRDNVYRLSGRRWWTMRLLAPLVERLGDINHLFGSLESWHLLRVVGRRPTLFTVTMPGAGLDPALYRKVSFFAAETEELAARLSALAIDRQRIAVVYPGVDLRRFAPTPPPSGAPFRLLFASSPAAASEFAARGIPLLVELARRVADVEVLIPWRCWDAPAEAVAALRALDPPDNFRVVRRDFADMNEVYRECHATVIAYRQGFGKSVPHSILEGLACGRPALVSDSCGIAPLIAARGAGVVVPRDIASLVAGVAVLRDTLHTCAAGAHALAQECFGLERCREQYERLYQQLAAGD
jgi:glycosyltransferase involved in cell wall biosynthesis